MTGPKRIQRKRTPGWRLADATSNPSGAVIVDRTSRYGNPFRISSAMEMFELTEPAARKTAVESFDRWLAGSRTDWESHEADLKRERILSNLHTLRGKDVACTCGPDELCHGDTLLEWAADPDLDDRIAKARARVDQQRTARGEKPLYDLKEP